MPKKKVGLIGCGFISGDHLNGWKCNKHAEVVAVCDIKKDRAKKRAQEFGIKRVYSDFREMLFHEDMDIVDIATPVSTHRELVLESVKKSVDILIEKPFADRLEDAVEMVRAGEENRIKLMVCQTYRWHPWYRQIKRELESGIIGRPYYANIMQRVSFAIPQGPEGKVPLLEDQPFYEDVELLLLLEQGCHYLDAFRYFFGEAKSVTASIQYISPYVKGDDLAVVIVNFSDLVAVLEDLWCTVGQQKTSVTFIQGEKGSIFFDGTGGAAPHRTEDTGNLQIVLSSGEKIERELDGTKYYARGFEKLIGHFVDCILTGDEPITSGRDNLKTLDIAFKAYEASRQQRTLRVGE